MKKFFLILALVLMSTSLFSYPSTSDAIATWYPPGGAWAYDHASGTWRPVGVTGSGSVDTRLKGTTSGGERNVDLDDSTHALNFVEYDHHEIHEGDGYTSASSSSALNSGNTFSMLLITPSNGERLHMVNQLESTGEGEITFVEAPTITASGTPHHKLNRRRDSTATCSCQIYINCSYSGGLVLRNFRCGAGKTQGGNARSTSEWVLKPATAYVIVFTARANGIYAELKSDWYEHADKD